MYGNPTRTVGDVFTAVKRQFGDESGVQLADNDLVMWINDAQDEINNRNSILKAKSSGTSVAGQGDYSFSTIIPSAQIHKIESIHYDGVRLPNMSFAQAEERIFAADPQRTQSGTPVLWYEWAGALTFWPTPDAAKAIDIYFTAKPARVNSTLSTPLSVPDKYYRDVVRYVLQQAYEMDEDWQASQAKAQQFDSSVNSMGEEDRTAQNMTYDTITVYDI